MRAVVLTLLLLLTACSQDDPSMRNAGGAGDKKQDQAKGETGHDAAHHGGEAKPAGCEPQGTSLSIAAKDIKFDKSCLAAPAGQPFSIKFDNQEAAPHSVDIAKEHGSPPLFKGATFSGPKTETYQVPELEAGKYHFHCGVHPDEMQGDFVVK